MIELKEKIIIITGASGFIGKQVAIKLSQLGANIILSGRNKKALDETFSLLEGDKHHILVHDVCNLNETMGFMKSIVETTKSKLSGLVYCSGIFPLRPLKSINYDYLHNMMLTNYYGFIEMAKCFSDKRISNGGSIVVLSSYASKNGDKGQLAYSASKGAIDSSVIVMAKELSKKNIRVNSIRPAALLPDYMELENLPIGVQQIINDMKTGPIEPINIAEQIAFLLSDNAHGLTGNCFDVKGYLS